MRDEAWVAACVLALVVGVLAGVFSLGQASGKAELCTAACEDAGFDRGVHTETVEGPICTCLREVPLGGSPWQK